jgi:30S ribosomal protein S31
MTRGWQAHADPTKFFHHAEFCAMGKGDKRTRRGKIFKGSFGKRRPKKPKNAATASTPKEPQA